MTCIFLDVSTSDVRLRVMILLGQRSPTHLCNAGFGCVFFFSVSSGARSKRFGYQRGFVMDAFRPLLDELHRGRVFASPCDDIRKLHPAILTTICQ